MRRHDLQARDVPGRAGLALDLGEVFKSGKKRGIDQKDRELAREKTESKWPQFDLSRHREAPLRRKGKKNRGEGWI